LVEILDCLANSELREVRSMRPERWLKVKEILLDALQKEPQERSAFLDDACGPDPGLRSEVESFLSSGAGSIRDFLRCARTDAVGFENGARLGPYEIDALIGRGGMGEVYRAHDPRLQRDVAIKVLPKEIEHQDIQRQRFWREARAISALQHPNITTLYDVGQEDGVDYLVMEYVDGDDLFRRMQAEVGVSEVVQWAVEIADALEAAHERGILHRDLKPSNIMLTSQGRIKVMDFGLAKRIDGGVSNSTTAVTLSTGPLTAPGMIIGTPGLYVAGTDNQPRPRWPVGSVFVWCDSGRNAQRTAPIPERHDH
jgi:serine/threonine protein kinase